MTSYNIFHITVTNYNRLYAIAVSTPTFNRHVFGYSNSDGK